MNLPGDHHNTKHKLKPKYHGPFPVSYCPGPTTVKIVLPPQIRIHPVLNRAMVCPYDGPATLPTVTNEHGDNVQVVEDILSSRVPKDRWWARCFITKWINDPSPTKQYRDDFVDYVSGDINQILIEFELHRTRAAFGAHLSDTLRIDWVYPPGPLLSIVQQPDGHRTTTVRDSDTILSIANKLSSEPLMSPEALLEMNVYRFSVKGDFLYLTDNKNGRSGLTFTSKLQHGTILRLPVSL